MCIFVYLYKLEQRMSCYFDTETDTAGISFQKVRGSNELDLCTVVKKVNDILGNLNGYVFVQVQLNMVLINITKLEVT
jgi:hypothetical protein